MKLHTSFEPKKSFRPGLIHLVLAIVLITLPIILTISNRLTLAATSPWVQTTWNGGVGSSTVNQYSSASNINTSINGEASIATTSNNWFNTSWAYRRKINIDNTTASLGTTSETLTNFPLLVRLQEGGNFIHSRAKSAGEDIRFTDCDGTTQLSYEIELWNSGGISSLWVRVPQIDINSNTDCVYLYYGNSAASDAQNAPNTWPSYTGVWHLGEDGPYSGLIIPDSSAGDNDLIRVEGSQTWPFPKQVDGQIGKAQHFGRINFQQSHLREADGANFNLEMTGDAPFTVSYWMYPIDTADSGNNQAGLFEFYSSGTLLTRGNLRSSYRLTSGLGGITRTGDTSVGALESYLPVAWQHWAISYDPVNSDVFIYKNGILVGQNLAWADNAFTTINRIFLGRSENTPSVPRHYMDEFRISNTYKSRAYLVADYMSQSNQMNSFQSEEVVFYPTASLTSNIFDTEQKSDWGVINYSIAGGNSVLKVRTSSQSNMSNANAWAECNAVVSGEDLTANNCVYDGDRYIQYLVNLSNGGVAGSTFTDISIAFSASETVLPLNNASDILINGVNSGSWINNEPTFSWSPGVDNVGGSGILGYCVALDEANPNSPSNLDPAITGGVLTGKDDGSRWDWCPFIVEGITLNLSTINDLVLTSGKQYYISVKAVDNAGNIFTSGTASTFQNLFSFKYDNISPTNPSFLSLPGNFISTKEATLIWPTTSGAASDNDSGVAGLQYRIGVNGTWFGDLHLGTEDLNDVLANDGNYTTSETYDYNNILEGINNIYLRTIDNAGNVSTANLTATLKVNSVAPAEPENLAVTPTTNTNNSYAFSWQPPDVFTGSVSGITYCYTVNVLPSALTCNYTGPGALNLSADSYATQPGINTLYLVARDEASNINYSVYTTIEFTYNGTAPSIPLNLEILDVSIKAQSDWRLVLSWSQPASVGAGISRYKVYRSTTNTTCTANFGAFNEVGTTLAATKIFSDTGLSEQRYYYCARACDSANNCSASSSTVSTIPTGKFTEPSTLIAQPTASQVSTKKGVINWVTDRESDSRIEYGLSSGVYFDEEVGNSAQVTNHTVTLNNLAAGTTYYYRAKWTDEDGNTGLSSEKTFTTSPPPSLQDVGAQSISVNSALIRFTSTNSYKAKILFGKSTGFGGNAEINTSTAQSTYTIPLTLLDDESTYYYTIVLVDLENTEYQGDTYTFTTLARPKISNVVIEEVKDQPSPTVRVIWNTNVATTSIVGFREANTNSDFLEAIEIETTLTHEKSITNLQPSSQYELVIRGTDNFGNQATSDSFRFTTSTDSRAPIISNIAIETLNIGNQENTERNAQLIVSWDTDEPASSLVQFGEGSTSNYTQTSQTDLNLRQKHVVIINNLNSSTVYSVQIISSDNSNNERKSSNFIAITPARNDNALDLILVNLRDIFGFIQF